MSKYFNFKPPLHNRKNMNATDAKKGEFFLNDKIKISGDTHFGLNCISLTSKYPL